jgi:predicted N-acetyltransferase YhbS
MELTMSRSEGVIALDRSTAAMAQVIAVVRESSLRRAVGNAAVDEPGVFGVRSGTAPILWAHDGITGDRLLGLAATAPELDEVYVEQRSSAAADALLATGEWELRDVMDQQVFLPGTQPLPEAEGVCTIDAAGPADMPLIRRALATAYQLPVHTVEAAYPDDFFVAAAPVRLFVARSESGEVIGTIAHRRQGNDAAMLFALSVRSDHRRRGVASDLLTAAMRSAVADGATILHGLSCAATRRVAASHGFERVGSWLYLLRRPVTDQ